MKLSIIIPTYNEKTTILEILRRVDRADTLNFKKEIIVIDDGSKDGTRDILRNIQNANIRILFHTQNRGKGSAIRTGLKFATGDYFLIQDADLEYSPENYKNMLGVVLRNDALVVYGSRFLGKKYGQVDIHHKEIPLHHLGNKMLTMITNIMYGSRLTDMETCYKLISRKALRGINLKSKRFDFEPEITAKLLKKGREIHEVSIKYSARVKKEGKKITWVDGIMAAYYLVKYRFVD